MLTRSIFISFFLIIWIYITFYVILPIIIISFLTILYIIMSLIGFCSIGLFLNEIFLIIKQKI